MTRLWPILEKKRRRGPEHCSYRSSLLKSEIDPRGLQLVALLDPIVPIFNGLLGLLIHLDALELP